MLDRRRQEPGSREHARKSRHHDAADLESSREGSRVNAPAPPSGTSDEFARVEAALYRHRRMPSAICAFTTRWMSERRLDEPSPSGFAIRSRIASSASLRSSFSAPPRNSLGVKIAEFERGIGDRRLAPPGHNRRGPAPHRPNEARRAGRRHYRPRRCCRHLLQWSSRRPSVRGPDSHPRSFRARSTCVRPATSAMSQEVPPTSMVIRFSKPASAPTADRRERRRQDRRGTGVPAAGAQLLRRKTAAGLHDLQRAQERVDERRCSAIWPR